jgi:glutathione S-transferase
VPVEPTTAAEITAFRWVPPMAAGLVRDLRVRWALEEAGVAYRERLFDFQHLPADYLREQPFNQVPAYRDEAVQLFETGAIVQYIGERSEALLPRELAARYRAMGWTYAALNSVEPAVMNLAVIDLFYPDEQWAKLRRPGAEEFANLKLQRVADWLGDKEWLEGRFTAGDLMMITVLRILRHTQLVAEYRNLAAYVARGEARPAFQRALADQLAAFERHQPEGIAA